MNFQILSYVLIAIGAIWGLLTFFALAQEEKNIKELVKSAEEHNRKSRLSRQSHGSE